MSEQSLFVRKSMRFNTLSFCFKLILSVGFFSHGSNDLCAGGTL